MTLLKIVVQQEETRIVARRQPFAFRVVCAIENFLPEPIPLALQFVFFIAGGAVEVREWTIIREASDIWSTTVGAIDPITNPTLGPNTRGLRAARISQGRLIELKFHCNQTALSHLAVMLEDADARVKPGHDAEGARAP